MEIGLDKFFSDYKPQINHIMRSKVSSNFADEDIAPYAGCMFETFGEELDYIKSFFNNPKQIWTIIDNDEDGDMVIQAGFWLVNRLGYIITEKPWENEDILVKDCMVDEPEE